MKTFWIILWVVFLAGLRWIGLIVATVVSFIITIPIGLLFSLIVWVVYLRQTEEELQSAYHEAQ